MDWRSGRAPHSGPTDCEFVINGLGQAANHKCAPLDPGDEWVPGLGQYLPLCA